MKVLRHKNFICFESVNYWFVNLHTKVSKIWINVHFETDRSFCVSVTSPWKPQTPTSDKHTDRQTRPMTACP